MKSGREIFSAIEEFFTLDPIKGGRSTMGRAWCSVSISLIMSLALTVTIGRLFAGVPSLENPAADTVYTDDFNRIGPYPGPYWTADSSYQIINNELANTDSVEALDKLAVFNPRINPIGVSFRWGTTADTAGVQRTGLALMLDDSTTTANGYFLFRNFNLNWYAIWTIENGVVTSQVAHSAQSELPFFSPGDEFQVVPWSDSQGNHFDIFVNNQFDVRLTDPDKLEGNSDTLYAGVMIDGGHDNNNNIDDFVFFKYSGDTTPPSAVGDLAIDSRTPTSITLTWTAPGDDDSTGTASRYDIRYSQSIISDLNFDNATQVMSEPVPSPSGSTEYFTVSGLSPDTRYYFALKSDDGFPQRNISGISNIPSGYTQDNIAPSAVSDVAVSGVNSRTVLLTWTATGDNDTTGTASWYDVRYSTSPITESNFGSATQAVGEPDPLPAGSSEEFTVGGLDPAVTYYFALKAVDESDNVSPLSNVPFATTVGVPTLVDDFERAVLGPDWSADPEFAISNGELANESLEDRWDFMSVYVPVTGVEDVKLRWGVDADSAGIGEGGFALMLDSPSPDANGYLIFRHRTYNYYALWTIVNGVPDSAVMQSPVSTLPYPQAGDTFEVVVSSDVHGHHFDCYINGVYDTRVSDPGKAQGNGSQLWYGVMLHGNRNNNVADFWLSGATANVPPGEFGLLSPADGSTVETGVPLLDWEDSVDPNLSDSVLYTLYYGTSAVFAPESTTVVSGLSGSDYTIPPMGILSLVRKSAGSVSDALVRSGVSGGLVPGGSAVRVPVSREAVVSPVGPEPSSLPDDVVIYWKVKAVDTGSLETWSLQQDWSFVVSIPDPPLPFDLLSPADGDTVETLTPTLSWQATTDPDPGDTVTYTLYYGTDPGLGSGTVIVSGLAEPAFTTPALDDNTLYYWKVEAVDSRDLITESNQEFSFYVRSPSGIGGGVGQLPPALPKAFALGQNYPNPFNPSTSIRFDIPAGASSEAGVHVLIQVYSLRGRLIRTLENGVRAPGSYVVHWDGRDDRGEKAGSGIYLYTIHAADFTATKKMVILK
jgi:hypothetical protein